MTKYDLDNTLRQMGSSKINFQVHPTVKEISPVEWNCLASKAAPVMEWEYFYILEESGCAALKDFTPFYIGLYDNSGNLIGLAPMFERPHGSYEFGLSGLINEVSAMAGAPAGKGLVGVVPFTPVPAYQFLTKESSKHIEEALWELFLKYIDFICETRGLSSSRFYFMAPLSSNFHDLFATLGYVGLVSNHYLWTNYYDSFDQFLQSLSSHKRRNIRREIKAIEEMKIEINLIKGTQADQEIYDKTFEIYKLTWEKYMPSGVKPYLNKNFFSLLRPFFHHRCLFSIAGRSGIDLGLALYYEKENHLYGRYWGSFQEVPFLHFVTCYYKPMIYAIEKGIKFIDPGFGGEHKALRGFKTVPSYHYVKFYGHKKAKCYFALERIIENW